MSTGTVFFSSIEPARLTQKAVKSARPTQANFTLDNILEKTPAATRASVRPATARPTPAPRLDRGDARQLAATRDQSRLDAVTSREDARSDALRQNSRAARDAETAATSRQNDSSRPGLNHDRASIRTQGKTPETSKTTHDAPEAAHAEDASAETDLKTTDHKTASAAEDAAAEALKTQEKDKLTNGEWPVGAENLATTAADEAVGTGVEATDLTAETVPGQPALAQFSLVQSSATASAENLQSATLGEIKAASAEQGNVATAAGDETLDPKGKKSGSAFAEASSKTAAHDGTRHAANSGEETANASASIKDQTSSELAKDAAKPSALKEFAAILDQIQPSLASPSAPEAQNTALTAASVAEAQAKAAAANRDEQLRPTPLGAVPIEIGMKALAGTKRFDIRLDPPELGRVDVRIEFGRDGDVSAHLVVDRIETLNLLQRDARHLERALDQAGLKTGENAVQISLSDRNPQNGSNQHDADQRSRSRRPETITPEISRALDAAPPVRMMRLGGVDMSV